jgi:hypothetical protein
MWCSKRCKACGKKSPQRRAPGADPPDRRRRLSGLVRPLARRGRKEHAGAAATDGERPAQERSLDTLEPLVRERFQILQQAIDLRKSEAPLH